MPEVIEGGYLYIAPAALTKVGGGKSEVYIKDQVGLEVYLIAQGIEGACCPCQTAKRFGGKDLARVVEGPRAASAYPRSLPDALPAQQSSRQAAHRGGLRSGRADADLQRGGPTRWRSGLDLVRGGIRSGWQGRITQDHGIRLSRVLRGVEEIRTLDGAVLRSGEARKLSEVSRDSRTVYVDPARLARKDREQLIHGPTELLTAILEEGSKGQQMQRYKGLGEMNPNQLWETTLDPEARTLLQVKVDDLAEADDIFTKLMGDVVEPRREFIQQKRAERREPRLLIGFGEAHIFSRRA